MTDFTMFQGDTKTLEFTVKDGDGAVVDLTGATSIRWNLARRVSSAAIITKDLDSGITVIDAANGRFDVSLTSADTENLSGRYYHEAEVIDASGDVATVETGATTINPALIKPSV